MSFDPNERYVRSQVDASRTNCDSCSHCHTSQSEVNYSLALRRWLCSGCYERLIAQAAKAAA